MINTYAGESMGSDCYYNRLNELLPINLVAVHLCSSICKESEQHFFNHLCSAHSQGLVAVQAGLRTRHITTLAAVCRNATLS